jgi:hypothetical protein
MATGQVTSMIPEKYRGTRFTADCWYHLSNHYQKYGTWLTFNQYQKVGDKTCKENVFKQVLDTMRMDVLFKKPEAVKSPDDPPPEPKSTAPAPAPEPPKTPNTPIANALINGLAQSAKERSKGPVTVMRRQEAESWIKAHLDSGYAPFKLEFQEPELDNAWWTKIRNALLHPPEQENSVPALTFETIHFDPRMHDDTKKVVKYLITLSPDKIEGMTRANYVDKTRHKVEDPNFQSARRFVRRLMENPAPKTNGTPAPAPAAAKVAAPKEPKPRKTSTSKGNTFETLAEIDLEAYAGCPQKDLKAFALELVKTLHPRGAEAQVRILAEPAGMEIRVPV